MSTVFVRTIRRSLTINTLWNLVNLRPRLPAPAPAPARCTAPQMPPRKSRHPPPVAVLPSLPARHPAARRPSLIWSTTQAAGVKDIGEWDRVESLSMACPALPLCGLAIGEAERSLPDFNARLRAVMDRVGLPKDEAFVVRATGERQPGPLILLLLLLCCSRRRPLSRAPPVGVHPLCCCRRCCRRWRRRCWCFWCCRCQGRPSPRPHSRTVPNPALLQAAPTAARGPTWPSWALWATAPTPTRCVCLSTCASAPALSAPLLRRPPWAPALRRGCPGGLQSECAPCGVPPGTHARCPLRAAGRTTRRTL